MEFLFIAFLGIISVFVCPIPVGFFCYLNNNEHKVDISYAIGNIVKIIAKKSTERKAKKHAKKVLFRLNRKNVKALSILQFDRLRLEIVAPHALSPAVSYPLSMCFAVCNDLLSHSFIDKKNVFSLSWGDEPYFQFTVRLKINLFLIFSLFFQIIRMEYRRKHGSDGNAA